MLIRSTRQACFVFLHNGLTLELVYSSSLIGADKKREHVPPRPMPEASHGVWLMGGTVLSEVHAGQA